MQYRQSWITVVLAIVSLVITGCSNQLEKDVPHEQTIIMRIGHTQPINHPRHQSLLRFKEIVEDKTNKRLEVHVYPAAQLGSDAEQMEMLKTGSLQAMRGNELEAAAPELLIYTMPFLFNDLEAAHKITRGPIGEKIAQFAEKNNIIILATGDVSGFRNITNNIKPITKPEDLHGLTLRTPPIESTTKTLEAFGANTLPADYDGLYMAIKSGKVDGQENPLVNITALKLEEVQKYLTIIEYQYLPDPFFVNLMWYNAMSPDIKQILKEASVEMMRYSDELNKHETDNSLLKLQKSMTIYTLTPEERKKFIERAKPVYDYYMRKKLFTIQELDEIRAVANNS